MEKQGARPTGCIGKLIGRLMNSFHTGVYAKYLDSHSPPENSVILDIGCGGGKIIKHLSDSDDGYQLLGIDHSPEMVELSKKVNRRGIGRKQVRIINASVSDIPIESNSVDLITAFETVQFWTDIDKSFSEVLRVLKNGGTLLIINRYPKQGSKWWKRAIMKNDRQYATRLRSAGFSIASTDLDHKKGWIVVKATK